MRGLLTEVASNMILDLAKPHSLFLWVELYVQVLAVVLLVTYPVWLLRDRWRASHQPPTETNDLRKFLCTNCGYQNLHPEKPCYVCGCTLMRDATLSEPSPHVSN
jgi:hypothetical protein